MNWISVKDKILEKLNDNDLLIDEPCNLIDGFINIPLEPMLLEIIIPRKYYSVISVIGKETGKIYYISLDSLGIL
jgi:hypothetical protein